MVRQRATAGPIGASSTMVCGRDTCRASVLRRWQPDDVGRLPAQRLRGRHRDTLASWLLQLPHGYPERNAVASLRGGGGIHRVAHVRFRLQPRLRACGRRAVAAAGCCCHAAQRGGVRACAVCAGGAPSQRHLGHLRPLVGARSYLPDGLWVWLRSDWFAAFLFFRRAAFVRRLHQCPRPVRGHTGVRDVRRRKLCAPVFRFNMLPFKQRLPRPWPVPS
jgi:hypothetical protein